MIIHLNFHVFNPNTFVFLVGKIKWASNQKDVLLFEIEIDTAIQYFRVSLVKLEIHGAVIYTHVLQEKNIATVIQVVHFMVQGLSIIPMISLKGEKE